MKYNTTTLITLLAFLCASHLLTAQCSNNFLVQDFENHTIASDWQPSGGFIYDDNPIDGIGGLRSDPAASSHQITQCFDLSSINNARVVFNYIGLNPEVLSVEYSCIY